MLKTYSKNNVTTTYFFNHEGIRAKKVVGNVTHHYLLIETFDRVFSVTLPGLAIRYFIDLIVPDKDYKL